MGLAFLVIVGLLAAFVAVIVPSTASLRRGNIEKMVNLCEAHARNLRSEDPAVVADSIRRWGVMCDYLKRCPRNGHIGYALEEIGREEERRRSCNS